MLIIRLLITRAASSASSFVNRASYRIVDRYRCESFRIAGDRIVINVGRRVIQEIGTLLRRRDLVHVPRWYPPVNRDSTRSRGISYLRGQRSDERKRGEKKRPRF